MSKGTFLLVVILGAVVLLIGSTIVDCCWFSLGEHVIAKRNCSLFKKPLPLGISPADVKKERVCDFNAGETGIIANDAFGNKTELDLDNFDCWHFLSAGGCRGWVMGSNLERP